MPVHVGAGDGTACAGAVRITAAVWRPAPELSRIATMPLRCCLLLLLLCAVVAGDAPPASEAPAPVFTDAEWSGSAPAAAAPPSTGSSLAGIATALVLVAALAVGLGFLARKVGVSRLLPRKGQHLAVVDSLPLGVKRTLTLVRLGDQVVLVGQAEQGLTHLGTFPAAVLGAAPEPVVAPSVPAPPSAFATLLARLPGGAR
jgi:flagellar biogenesis protein FliO